MVALVKFSKYNSNSSSKRKHIIARQQLALSLSLNESNGEERVASTDVPDRHISLQ